MLEPAPALARLVEKNLDSVVQRALSLTMDVLPPRFEPARSYIGIQIADYLRLSLEALRSEDPASFVARREEISLRLATTCALPLEHSMHVEAHVRAAIWDLLLPQIQHDHEQLLLLVREMRTFEALLGDVMSAVAQTHSRVKDERIDALHEGTLQRQQGFSALEEVETLLISSGELQPTLDLITMRMGELSGSGVVFLLLQDPGEQRVSLRSVWGADPATMAWFRDVGSKIVSMAGSFGTVVGPAEVADLRRIAMIPDQIRAELARSSLLSALLLPLLLGDRTIGVVVLCSDRRRSCGDEEVRRYTLLANQAAIAINSAWLYESSQQKTEELASSSHELENLAREKDQLYRELQEKVTNLVALQEVSQTVVSSLDLREVLQTITTQTTQVLGASKATVVALNSQTGAFECIAMTGFSQAYADRVKAGRYGLSSSTLTAMAVRLERPQWTNDALIDDRFPETIELARLGGYRSMLAVPIERADPPTTLCVYADEPDAFSEARVENLGLLANHAAIAIRNAQLYAQQVHSKQRAAFLAEISKLFNSSLELKSVLQMVAEKVTQVLGDGCVIYELPEGSDLLEANIVYRRDPAKTEILRQLLEATPPRLGVGVAGQVAQSGQSMLIVDARGRDLPDRDRPHLKELNLISTIGVPLKVKNRVLGAMVTSVTDSERHFDEDDLALAEAIAERAAVAIENARLYESERKRVNALEEVNQLKSDFASSVSHELRTPLTTIKGSLQTLLRSWERMGEKKHRHYVEMAHDASDRLLRLIEDILFVSRVEAVRPRTPMIPVDIGPIVQRAVSDVKMQHAARTIKASLPSQPLQVLAEESRLLRVLVNLLDNAAKYSGTGTTVYVGLKVAREEVTVSVTDKGIGIAAQDQPRLFTRFGRVGLAARTQPGTGLGLFISKQLVEEMGGRIWLESQPGKGSTFYFTLPASPEEGVQPRN